MIKLPKQNFFTLLDISSQKASFNILKTLLLGFFAGMYIALGAIFFISITAYGGNPGLVQFAGGIGFSLGLILVVIGGAELFTGNNLMVMGLPDRRLTLLSLLKNWLFSYIGNFIGALLVVLLVYLSYQQNVGDGQIGERILTIAQGKLTLGFSTAFFRGILCNMLVCLAIWISSASDSVSGKILAIIFPISAFVAMGFEHSVANMFFIPMGLVVKGSLIEPFTIGHFLLYNLLPVTLGNIVGGSFLIGLIYWAAYKSDPNT